MTQQLGFFEEEDRSIARTPQGEIVYYPAVFTSAESASLYKQLLDAVPWSHDTMKMYDKMVDVPRLVAWYRDRDSLPEPLERIRTKGQELLGARFNGVSLNYYRDGSDSVAWHSDHNEELARERMVALVSLGATRQMHFRTKAVPRRQLRCDLAPGSVLVMRGDVQSLWEHCIPKVSRGTDARISVALRTKV
ncbi:MAG: alpha-ketoglutarate-dependent dioxygenase AlkB [Candidatus Eremiobacteraeota bacterium]|nr:alpha-ketoglutarate-dependent dioxygenase AlkB [Candidatus Eremiobacteraeota bacterium]